MAPEQVAATDPDAPQTEVTIESAIEHAKRAFALKKYEQAVDHYATALELMTIEFGEDAPQTADLYFSYGKALLENAISQASVLGKEQPEDEADSHNKASESSTSANGPLLSFSGDAEDVDDEQGGEGDAAVDLFAQALQDVEQAEAETAEDEAEDAEPEDDFNAAWEVLDLARAIYDKQKGDAEVALKLADTYIALGDVSLETEKFDQAITDYTAGLSLKKDLLPLSSRQIAEAHYKLSMVLDLTSGRLADAIIHAEKALESVETRLAELRDGLNGQIQLQAQEDIKEKGKAVGGRLARDDLVQNMTRAQIEGEVKEMEGLKEDLALKVEELKTTPNESAPSAPALVAQALDKELNIPSSSSGPAPTTVNDLTSMVVKKKKGDNLKRGPADESDSTSSAKKPKVE